MCRFGGFGFKGDWGPIFHSLKSMQCVTAPVVILSRSYLPPFPVQTSTSCPRCSLFRTNRHPVTNLPAVCPDLYHNLSNALQCIRLSFIAKLNNMLCTEFPSRQPVSELTIVDRSRLYSAVSQVCTPPFFPANFIPYVSRQILVSISLSFTSIHQVITAPLEPCEPVAFVWHGRSVKVAFQVLPH
jgi:hypothetical protein